MDNNLKAALLHEREQMRKRRHHREFMTLYSDNTCPICGGRHMTGKVCRRHRGSICAKHCCTCEYYEATFSHCTYRETEPPDMRKWVLICSHHEKAELWRGIYTREIIRHANARAPNAPSSETAKLYETVAKRSTPKYIVMDTHDENGDHTVVDADTGEVQPFIVKHLAQLDTWACVRYLDIGA
mgnify:CR=1 FL=1